MLAAAESRMPETRKLTTTTVTPIAAAIAPSMPRSSPAAATIKGPTTPPRRTMWRAGVASTSARIVTSGNRPHPPEPDDRPGDYPDHDEQRVGPDQLVPDGAEQQTRHYRPEECGRIGGGSGGFRYGTGD